jgi:hypothetical protein
MSVTESFLVDEAGLDTLIHGFKDGSWPGREFRHTAHLAVCACYILDGDDAMDQLRIGIRRYNESQGGKNTEESGYHETITRFWVDLVREAIASMPAGLTRLDVAREIVARFGCRRDLFRQYYDFDVLKSPEARAVWIPPTVKVSR